jgi:LemA protein
METLIVVAVVVLVGLYGVKVYNGLVSLRTRVEEAWSDIQVQMKRRYDLIPNLVETVKGYASHERDTLEAVVKARNAAVATTGSPEQQAAAERAVTGALGKLFALAEAYPELKADQNFRALQDELVATEEKLGASRRFYNGSVRDLNVMVEQFPSNLIAGFFKFGKAQFFELDEDERAAASKPVKVSFN